VVQLISIRLGWMTSLLIIPIIYTIHRAYREQIASIAARQTHLEETKALHLRTIEALAMAIEAKDQNTHDHLVRVRVYVSEIGRIMGLDSAQMEALVTAAFLHDIGKLAVPEHIVNKPGKLTPEEFDKIKIHPVVGADILDRVRFPYPVTPIVRSHHEAWDGSGYPEGLKGEDIPIGARILTAVDCFDAMASDRPYRRALPLDGAMAHVKSLAGKQFDPNVVRVLEEHYHELETLARHESQSPSPLQIEPSSTRGTAPGAGFERESAVTAAMEEAAAAAAAAPARTQPSFNQSSFPREALTLISAASKEAQAIFEISRSLGNSIRANETASAMSTSLRNWIACDCFAIYLKKGDYLIPHYMDGDGISSFAPSPILSGEGLSGWVFKSGKPIVNGNPEVEPNYIGTSGSPGQMRSALSLPLYEPGKEIFGVLTLYSTAADAFSRENLRIMMALESKLSLALQNALIFRDADNGARLDYLTQLPNIRQFSFQMEVELSNARRSGESLGVVVCDLNSFKAVNDRHGHAVGDKLLRAIADGFKETCRKEDTVARMGGDEFVFLLPGADSQNCATKLLSLEMTVREVCASLQIGIDVSTSAGAAFFPEDADSAEALLDLADHRMYSHKRSSAPKNRAKRDFFVPYTSAT
jgi:diguanylate cyclase (GGDEF)-like protein/putative nucleotidyltransferase with HDIG domain